MLGFEAASTVDAVGPGVTGTSLGDGVTALLGSAEAAVGVLRQLNVKSGVTLLLFGGGSAGIIATQLAVARGIKVISAGGRTAAWPAARDMPPGPTGSSD